MARFKKDVTKSNLILPEKKIIQQKGTGQSVRDRAGNRAEPVELIIKAEETLRQTISTTGVPHYLQLLTTLGGTLTYDPYSMALPTTAPGFGIVIPRSGVYTFQFGYAIEPTNNIIDRTSIHILYMDINAAGEVYQNYRTNVCLVHLASETFPKPHTSVGAILLNAGDTFVPALRSFSNCAYIYFNTFILRLVR